MSNKLGVLISPVAVATITNGQTGASLQPLDLGNTYSWLVVRCADVSHVDDPADTLSFEIGVTVDDTMLDVLLRENSIAKALILDAPFQEVVFVGAARRVRPLLSAAASGGSVVIEIYGIDSGVLDT